MYRYDEFDADFVAERVAQFSDQVARRLEGSLSEEQFRPLRLMNGVYLQLHAYMLRIAVPYGTLSSKQMRKLAHIARTYDKGYGHFTTRQNLQFNWPALKDCPAILQELASVEMHCIQTSGNCIRNTTADQFAGAAADEIEDPRPYAEIIRQWSSLHPEFSFLPRKFKIAMTGAPTDRAAIQVHDIGYQVVRNDAGEVGFAVYVGGGQGRTPLVAHKIRDFLPKADLLAYTNSILRVYNLEGRRDNKYKARIKILVHEKGADVIRDAVEADFATNRDAGLTLPQEEIDRIIAYFAMPELADRPASSDAFEARKQSDPAFGLFAARNVFPHKVPGHGIVTISLKPIGGIPGDASAEQMDLMADLAEGYSADELRVSHEQNIVLPHVALDDIPAVYDALVAAGLATQNVGLVSDIICCPGLDYCALATARSIPIAQRISDRFGAPGRAAEIGDLKIKISGCINACGHHHVGNIGILGLEKNGVESYQLTLGGTADETCTVGDITGRGFSSEKIVDAVETVVDTYLSVRKDKDEDFLAAYRRVGMKPFKEALYAHA
ncbi:Sulfite reductase (NADPH) hemoprotein beta-component [Beijerinckiaceae bacterium RH AL1]|nr:nitrite/sulfite reductase [Beijerinckiaceae bacterium]VVB45724.1 Sulfite reductase (NADPH) hemoprotein beta-component [Beijerinckiaceae bacterium RH CH11]VVB45799.1 Sulfite reductase (NADPH) hemoprotein beta-component [Beijerinckiaceae bacterium RH AL8]VVC55008.1 Sulfite reductase (NADPH) hemoprotein beta-component [Beijerinckiaceae bacterium RH AL1]